MNTFDWEEPIDPRIQVRKDRLAFFLSSGALAASGLYMMVLVVTMLSMDRGLRRVMDNPNWDLALGLPLLLAHLFASVLFLGRSSDRRRSIQVAFMAVITLVGLALWCAEHARWLGFEEQASPSFADPIRTLLLRSMSLVRVLILVELAAIATRSSGRQDLVGLRQGAVTASVVGFGLWLMMSLEHVNWQVWPLRWRVLRDLNWFLILAVSILARAIGSLMAAVLCGHACASRSRELEDLEVEAKAKDPFRSLHPWN